MASSADKISPQPPSPKQLTQTAQTDSPFFRLPAELRNMIYAYASTTTTMARRLQHTSGGDVPEHLWDRSFRLENDIRGLSQTCRQLQQETAAFPLQPPLLLVLPFYIDLYTLVHIVGPQECAKICEMEIGEEFALRCPGKGAGLWRRSVQRGNWSEKNAAEAVFAGLEVVRAKADQETVPLMQDALRACGLWHCAWELY
ncbi:hypothetical protein OPT61_g3268 [Boeremia exigua]|uniref:Uncharacterized protein n=1 Tax=Boeremia exigua TaxID=749465 RepID=A0ACC2IIE0_9PLEO|nr:hypothetical protein OPT61_g3268 [Boeremia exigua]